MNEVTALELARNWVGRRKDVRAHLIRLAREANPRSANYADAEPRTYSNAVRKLWHFPSDLSEERLLWLIDNGAVDIFAMKED